MSSPETEALSRWILAEHMRIHGMKRVPKRQRDAIHERAQRLIDIGTKNGTIRVLKRNSKPAAMVLCAPSRSPRIKNQQSIHAFYEKRGLGSSRAWLRKNVAKLAREAPRYTQIGLSVKEDEIFRSDLARAGFHTRYEVLKGDTKSALSQLIRKKNPPKNLVHLGLELKPVTLSSELDQVMRLQKRVALRSKTHGYFSHTPAQLKQDREEYEQILSKKNGLILGVYRGAKLLGLMITGIHGDLSPSKKHGGFSFFLDPSIQGLGITKTGYRLMLEFLLANRVQKFFGGTSQPAIQSLGRTMKREVQFVIHVKMR